mmetsp:Transcript_15280/g.36659  ORF Transcript_15280/g.36659 Transcript_15280/m.36659 type:complete len:170 (+) Transcript_15280:428-937(+)
MEGVIGPNLSSALLEGCDTSSSKEVAVGTNPTAIVPEGEDSVSSLLRLEEENPLGERMWGGPTLTRRKALLSALNNIESDAAMETSLVWWLEDCNDQMGSSSSYSSESLSINEFDPGRTCQKPTGDLESTFDEDDPSLLLLPLEDSDESETDLSRFLPNSNAALSLSML